ncbi:hypothetical protein EHS39_28065 [Ensifer sp. MPMI2T]|nr:hypothetical protein EHS39_28065 [Ensifer sp. MPMI2T]
MALTPLAGEGDAELGAALFPQTPMSREAAPHAPSPRLREEGTGRRMRDAHRTRANANPVAAGSFASGRANNRQAARSIPWRRSSPVAH